MDKKFKVTFRGKQTLEFKEGTTFKEISEYFKQCYNYAFSCGARNRHGYSLSYVFPYRK